MALVNVVNMMVLDNPTAFLNPFQFEITFECIQELEEDLEWKVVYVGSAESSEHDQVLDEILVGPVPVGINKFVLQAEPPDPRRIPSNDILGVTVVLVTCSYREREFVRIGYYVSNEYADPYDQDTGPPKPLDLQKVTRQILADKPRVTRFAINWTGQDDDNTPPAQTTGHDSDHANNAQDDNPDDSFIMDDTQQGDLHQQEDDDEEEDEEDGDVNMELDL